MSGPIDGHNLDHLIPVLRNVRDDTSEGPVLIHAITRKGKGYAPAEGSSDRYHGVGKFDVATGEIAKSTSNKPSWDEGVRRQSDQRGAARRFDRGDHGGNAVRDRR